MSKSIIYTLLFCCLSVYSLQAQNYNLLKQADSLAQVGAYDASLQILRDILNSNPRNFQKSEAFYHMSYVYLQLHDLEKARVYNQRSLDIKNRIGYEYISENYMRFGTIALKNGAYEKALDYFLEAKQLPVEYMQFSGILEGYLATAYEKLGMFEKSLESYYSSLEILAWEFGEQHPDVAVTHYNLGNLYARMGDTPKAKEHYQKAIEIESQLIPNGVNYRLALVYNAMGYLMFKETYDNEIALSFFQLAAIKSLKNRRLTALAQINVAQILFNQRLFERSESAVNTAFGMLNISEEENPRYYIASILDKQLYTQGLQIKSEILLNRYLQEDKLDLLERALENSEFAVEVFESRMLDQYTEDSQLRLLLQSKDVYEQTLYIAALLYQKTNDLKYLDKAFQYAERGKSIVLKNQMQQMYGLLGDDLVDQNILEEEERLRNQITFLQTDLGLRYQKDNYRRISLDLEREYRDLIQKVEAAAPQYFELRYADHKASISSVQEKLKGDEVVLSYFLGEELYYIFAISKQKTSLHFAPQNAPLPTKTKVEAKQLQKKAKNKFPVPNQNKNEETPDFRLPDVGIYTQVSEEDMDVKSGISVGLGGTIRLSKKEFIDANYILYRRLIEPVQPVLKGKDHLIISPHRDLHYVSFDGLLRAKPKGKIKYKKLKYLIRDYAISYIPSADYLTSRSGKNNLTQINLSAWAPVFDPADSLGYELEASDLLLDTVHFVSEPLRSLKPDRSGFVALKYSESEVRSILEVLAKEKQSGKGRIKDMASESSFKAEANQYSILHIASHSFVNIQHPKLSGIALAAPQDQEDGILYAGEVMNMRLDSTDLVVMSSCESGSGKLVKGEGLLSLNRAFQFAGAKNTISTRWKVTDKSTAQFMKYFYKKLLDEKDYAKALQYAKVKMIKRSKTSIPRLWAGFMLTSF